MTASLDPLGDHTVSRLMVERERRKAIATEATVLKMMRRSFFRDISAKFARNKPLDGEDLARIAKAFETQIDPNIHCLRSHDRTVGPTRIHPKGEAYEKGRIAVSTVDGGFRLYSISMGVTRKRAMIDVTPTCMSWTIHAAERFYQRAGGDHDGTAMIGAALADNFAAASLAMDVVAEGGLPPRLAIPCEGGLLLGEVHLEHRNARQGTDILHDRMQSVTVTPRPLSISRWTLRAPDAEWSPCWKGATFVCADLLHDNQLAFIDEWERIKEGRFLKEISRHLTRIVTTKYRHDQKVTDALIEGLEAAREEMRDLLRQPWVRVAMGNDAYNVPPLPEVRAIGKGDPRLRSEIEEFNHEMESVSFAWR